MDDPTFEEAPWLIVFGRLNDALHQLPVDHECGLMVILQEIRSAVAECRDGPLRSSDVFGDRTARIGNPDLDRATINHLERQNLNIRLFNRRFTRKTLGYSKKFWNHQYSVALQVAFHNFCRVSHAHGQTRAQAHGITDH